MKILIASDAPWHCTGYGVQLREFSRRMVEDGHEVVIYCAGAFMGGNVQYEPGIRVVGAGGGDDRWGNRSWGEIAMDIDPDVIFTWLDIHGMQSYGWTEAPTYMWAPIDTHPLPKDEFHILGRATKIMCPSKWGMEKLADEGFESVYVPCGVDMKVYDIDDEGRQNWRKQIKPAIDDDTFLIGMVGLNTGSPDRKGYGYAFDVIRAFVDNHPDEKINAYIHSDPYGDGMALNLINMRQCLKLEDVIAFNPPQLPWGRTEKYMRDMYNAFDVYLTTSVTEGFGVPVVEAQACGTPVVVNACSSLTELAKGPGGYRSKYLCESWVNTCTKIYLPDVPGMLQMLEAAYSDWKDKQHDRVAIRASVERFDLQRVYDTYWRPLLEDVPAKINYEHAGGELGPKLMLATGSNPPADRNGWILHDREKFSDEIDVAHDLNTFPYPWPDNSMGYIEFEDCIEHLKADITQVMDELHRILRPGGYLYIHTAEAGSWQLMKDPTHIQGFWIESFDYYDPETAIGKNYCYSKSGWKILKRTANNGGLVFVMQPRKEALPTFVEHFPDETGEHNPEKCGTCVAKEAVLV